MNTVFIIASKFDLPRQSPHDCASCVGVKLVLPALLGGVDSKAWRSKQGSVQMLGAMAYLAPQPLSTALPKVVPKLSQTLSDPHPKVQAAARQALREVAHFSYWLARISKPGEQMLAYGRYWSFPSAA